MRVVPYLHLVIAVIGAGLGLGSSYSNHLQEPRIVSLHIRSEIVVRFCTSVITSTIMNDDDMSREVTFEVTLSEEAFISNFTMRIGEDYYPGVVREKLLAQKQYKEAKKDGQSAGHIGKRPRHSNKFRVSINVAARTEVTFKLTYNELLRRTRSIYEHTVFVDPGQVVDQLLVEVLIKESSEITTLRVTPLRNDIIPNPSITARNPLASIQRLSSTSAYIRYEPTLSQQMSVSEQGISGLFAVEYDIRRRQDAGEILIVNGYFVHFFSPAGLDPIPKKIIFILDVSGSMAGRKMQQLKDAMLIILDDLVQGDSFNILLFSSSVRSWKNKLVRVNKKTVRVAKRFIQKMKIKGWTNINDALLDGLSIISSTNQTESAPLIFFLTDGEATYGEVNTKNILSNIRKTNNGSTPVFTLSFGNHADYNFLKTLSTQNNAFSRKIYEASDSALQITGLYKEISTVLMSNITFQYMNNSIDEKTVTKTQFSNLYRGTEFVISGKLLDNSIAALSVNVLGDLASGNSISSSVTNLRVGSNFNYSSQLEFSVDFEKITERLWAYMTIKQLLEERLRVEDSRKRDELKKRATEIALKYNFVTSLTSMVVTKPTTDDEDSDSEVELQDDDQSNKPTFSHFSGQSSASQAFGAAGHYSPFDDAPNPKPTVSHFWDQSSAIQAFGAASHYSSFADNDPHFIIRIRGLEESVCFDIMGEQRDVFQLIRDDIADIRVNALIVGNGKQTRNEAKKQRREKRNRLRKFRMRNIDKTYLGKVVIVRKNFNMTVTPEKMKINGVALPWRNDTAVISNRNRVVTDGTGSMVALLFPDKITLLVVRHLRTRSQLQAGKVNYLGFYIVNQKGFSNKAHGILGQFLYRYISVDKKKMKNGHQTGRLNIRGNIRRPRRVMSSLGKRLNMATNTSVTCWMVQRNGRGLLDGSYKDYILRGPSVSHSSQEH